MKCFSDNDLLKTYCGWLGKVIGVRYGSLVEMWDSEQIIEKYKDVDGYFQDYHDYAADDDLNGPLFFYRALKDCKDFSRYGFKDLSSCWQNLVPYEHGFYWWGGYGISEEHTAYLNILNGIMPPQSGSISQNGKVMAEQIGGQIFSDVWGLVANDNIDLAAELAKKASQVSHDGEAVYGGIFIASMISAAFQATNCEEMIEKALTKIPNDCLYSLMVKDLIAFFRKNKSKEECFKYIRTNYWKDKYPGNCHIIPNAAIIVYSLLYGENDFLKTLKIALYSGFDTDCNVGNLGTIMGVLTMLEGVDYETWIKPINDIVCCSSLLGYSNITTIPAFAIDVFKTSLKINNADYRGKYKELLLNGIDDVELFFIFPNSTSGIREENANVSFEKDKLKIILSDKKATIYYKTYYGKKDFEDNRYDPATSPKVYNGQAIHIDYENDEGVDAYIFVEDVHTNKRYYSFLNARHYKIDIPKNSLIGKIGLEIKGKRNDAVYLKSVYVDGNVDYIIDFSKEYNEEYAPHHNEVSQCTYYRGTWRIENNMLRGSASKDGLLLTSKPLKDFVFETTIRFEKNSVGGVAFKIKGAKKNYKVVINDGKCFLVKQYDNYDILGFKEIPCKESYKIRVKCFDNCIEVYVDDKLVINFIDKNVIESGCIGACVDEDSVVEFDKFVIKELETSR